MSEEIQNIKEKAPAIKRSSPFLLDLLMIAGIAFFGVLSLLYLISIIWSGWIEAVTAKYQSNGHEGSISMKAGMILGFLLHFSGFIGIFLLFKKVRIGFLLSLPAILLILIFHFLNPVSAIVSPFIYTGFLALIMIFYLRIR